METISVNQKFNIAEILRYAPKGLKLHSPIFGDVKFKEIDDDNCVVINDKYNNLRWFYEHGTYFPYDENNFSEGECLLFPSSNHRCWNHWQNTLFLESIGSVCVDNITGYKYILENNGTFFSEGTGSGYSVVIENDESNYFLNSRYASPEETKEFFDELEKNGYKWDGKKVVKKEDEPKFHEGDWVVLNNDICQIVKREEGCNKLVTVFGIEKELVNERNLSTARLWTIDDAKNGDVLAAQECYVIFKEIDGLNIKCHCTYHYMGFSPSFHINTLQNKTAFHPATKEQRDTLFTKIKEEGYEWNADTKKLAKTTIPIPKFRVGDIIKHKSTGEISTIKKVCSDFYVLDNDYALFFESQNMWELIASKVNPTLEEKVSILADEILALKERVNALELQVIKQCLDKNRLDSLESKMIMIEMKLSALEYGSTPLTLIQNPFLYPGKVTCDDAQCYKSKSASDTFETPDKAGDCVTLKDMKS